MRRKRVKRRLYSEWEKDWDKTSLEIPDFKFNDDGTILMLDCFDEVYPKTRDSRITKEFLDNIRFLSKMLLPCLKKNIAN